MKKILLAAMLSIAMPYFSQTINEDSIYPHYTEQIDHIFEHVDLTQVPNGLLRDFGIPLIEPQIYNGQLDTINYTNTDAFGLLYATLTAMAIDTNQSLPPPNAYMNVIASQTVRQPIMLLGILYSYYQIDSNAIANEQMIIQNGQIYDVPNRTTSPYLSRTTFLMTSATDLVRSNKLKLAFDANYFYNNTGTTISELWIDYDDGQGYQLVSLTRLPEITYTEPGLKHIKFKIVTSTAAIFESHTRLVMEFDPPEKALGDIPYLTEPESFHVMSPQSFAGVNSGATVFISYACGHTNLQKPFIWAEGYNPASYITALDQRLYYLDAVERIYSGVYPGDQRNVSDYLQAEGYDLVVIDYDDGGTYLELNAMVIEEAIRQINIRKHQNGSNEKNVVMGQSMGGMCLRYALRDMEVKGENHEVGTYVSFDSGHLGTNIPLGVQYALKHISNISVGRQKAKLQMYVGLLQEAYRILDLPSSREMLYYHASEEWFGGNWETDYNNPSLHDTYYLAQNGTLGMPQNCDRIAIINGSLNGSPGGGQDFDAGAEVVKYYGNSLLLGPVVGTLFADKFYQNPIFLAMHSEVFLLSSGTNATVDIKIHALEDMSPDDQRIYRGNIVATALTVPVIFTICHKDVKEKIGIDAAPGGFLGPYVKPPISILGLQTFKLSAFCFTPTMSTLNDYTNSNSYTHSVALGNDFTNKYAYLDNDGLNGLQTYTGLTNYLTFNDHPYNNSGHTWFNYQNAPAMVRYLTGVDQLSALNVLNSTDHYNFGKLELTPELEQANPTVIRTTSKITRSIALTGAFMGVNSGDYIGLNQNTGTIISNPAGFFRVDIVRNCDENNPIVVSLGESSALEVGDEGGRSGDLYIQQGNSLVIGDFSKLEIHSGSRVIVESGATLQLNQQSNLIVHNEASVIVKPGGKLIYNQNAAFTTLDENSRLYIQGTLALGQNATFKVSRSGSNPSGIVIFTGAPHITAESGASFYFDAIGDYDPVVEVDANTYVAFDDPDLLQVQFTQCAVVMDAHGNMTVAPKLLVDHSTFQGRDRQDAKLTFRSKNQFYESTFTDIILQGDEYYPASDIVKISNCTFNTLRTDMQGTTTYHIAVYGKGYDIHDCTFTNLINEASVYSEDLTLTSGISNCTFTSTIGGTAAMEDRSNVEIDFYSNTLSNLREAVIKSSGILTMSCNTMSNMTYRYITATDGAKVNLSTDNGGGYNQFGTCTDLNYWSHIWLTNADIDMTHGANTFTYNNYHQYFVTGTLPYFCFSSYFCARNFDLNNLNYTPSAPSSTFNLKSVNNIAVQCSNANLYFDPACGSMNPGGPTDPGDPGDGGSEESSMVLSNYYSEIMDETVRLDDGVKYATDQTTEISESSGNDVNAMNRFDEIFSSSIPTVGDNRHFMKNAQDVMKTTVENMVLYSVSDVSQNQAAFTPEFDTYVNSLNKLSDSIIDTNNYREQFYLEMKKVTLFRTLDKPEMALELIQNIEACGVDSAEQVLLNREKVYAQRVIAAAQYDPEIDSVFEFKPTGLIEPIANAKSQYYFGSQIVDPSSITYMVCQEDQKSLHSVDNRATDGVTMSLFPNPATEELNYQILDESYSDGEIKVIQPDGRTVLQLNTQTGAENRINVAQWASGVYQFVYYRANGTIIQRRFIVK